MHDYLSLHPEIFMSDPKEIHYYADGDYNKQPIEWYKSFFKTDKKIVGTTPQSYTKCHNKYYKNIPERIKQHNPNVKMIYIVRDPIERYASHILESYHCDPAHDIQYSIESNNYLKTSMYYMQMEAFLKYFDLGQFHFLSLEGLAKNKLFELNRIFDFLGVEKVNDEKVFDFISNDESTKVIPLIVKSKLLYRLGNKISPGLTSTIGAAVSKIFYKKLLTKPNLTVEKREELGQELKEDMGKFRSLTGLPFSEWSI